MSDVPLLKEFEDTYNGEVISKAEARKLINIALRKFQDYLNKDESFEDEVMRVEVLNKFTDVFGVLDSHDKLKDGDMIGTKRICILKKEVGK
jgi:hypothetical protein